MHSSLTAQQVTPTFCGGVPSEKESGGTSPKASPRCDRGKGDDDV
eukprot:CAMPEP_0179084066 /NCGR_PEP_ID=MMETSP0796-20121207/37996_1 /TAXON_ID=73915 /ORGANISM="Pyrodinium bahamense, Strain pbaha01" /LENGTH=44 /DNA_ID= /DNA_START= /DNA_END= /DNA_ORIENTATION=